MEKGTDLVFLKDIIYLYIAYARTSVRITVDAAGKYGCGASKSVPNGDRFGRGGISQYSSIAALQQVDFAVGGSILNICIATSVLNL